MVKYNVEREGPERREIVNSLEPILFYFQRESEEERIDYAKLRQLSIDVTKMSLSGKQAQEDIKSFFVPLERSKIDALWPEVEIVREWPEEGFFTKTYHGAAAVQDLVNSVSDFPFWKFKLLGTRE